MSVLQTENIILLIFPSKPIANSKHPIRFAFPQNHLKLTMKTIKLNILVALASAAFVMSSCGEAEQADTGPKYNFERADTLPSGYLEELGIVKTNIEVTANLFAKMSEKGMAFNESILFPAGKSFSGSSKQAMGIGATGSDLVYAVSFNQNQSSMNRMKGLIDLSKALGVGEAFEEDILTKMASDDTTVNKSVLLTKAYINAKNQLFSDERAQLATFMVIGGWLEGLHIGGEMVKADLSSEEVRLGFWEICNTYESVVHLCEVFKNNQEMTTLGEQIKEIAPLLGPIRKNPKKFTVEEVQALNDGVTKLRNSVM